MEQSKPRLTTDAFLSEHVSDQSDDRKPGAGHCTGVCHFRRSRSVMFDVHEKRKERSGEFAVHISASFKGQHHVTLGFHLNREQEPRNTDINEITHESNPSIGPCLLQRHSQSVIMLAQRSTQQMLRRRMSPPIDSAWHQRPAMNNIMPRS